MTSLSTPPRTPSGLRSRSDAAARASAHACRLQEADLRHVLAWNADWSALPPLPSAVRQAHRVIALTGRPGDEIIGAAGLLADSPHDTLAVTFGLAPFEPDSRACADDVARLRADDWRRALQHLGVRSARTFRLLDLDPTAWEPAMVRILLRWLAPGDLVLAPWRHEPDPDRQAVGRAAARAVRGCPGARLIEYPVRAWQDLTVADVTRLGWRMRRVQCSPEADRLRRVALGVYRGGLPRLVGDPAMVHAGLRGQDCQFTLERLAS